MRPSVIAGAALALAAGSAAAQQPAAPQELVATRPGVMCRSADALARLTLSNGDSRTHAASAQPGDLALATSGGCIDIPLGARVAVRQAFRNTSIVGYGATDAPPYVVPNVDFAPAGPQGGGPGPGAGPAAPAPAPAPAGAIPPGYQVVQRLPVAAPAGGALVLLEDRRLTPRVRDQFWGAGDIGNALEPNDPLLAELGRRPLLDARLELLSPAGAVVAQSAPNYPLARIEPAPIHGLPTPAVLFTVDESAGMGGFSGPSTVLLTPATTQLASVPFVPDRGGTGGAIELATTLHAGWRIVPARAGGPEEIESAFCPGGEQPKHLTTSTYRFRDGQWHGAERRGASCDDIEAMPPRSAFP